MNIVNQPIQGLINSTNWRDAPLDVDADGSLIRPSLHDTEFYGLLQIGKKQHLLLFAQPNSVNRIAIVISEVSMLRASSFLEGNIVLDISICSGSDENPTILEKYLEVLHDLNNIKVEQTRLALRNLISQQVEKVMSGDLSILCITPSYGCTLLALFQHIQLFCFTEN